jgi:uncharacterized protein YaaR (DUF327 family)
MTTTPKEAKTFISTKTEIDNKFDSTWEKIIKKEEKEKDLAQPIQRIVGTCMDMCPYEEWLERMHTK